MASNSACAASGPISRKRCPNTARNSLMLVMFWLSSRPSRRVRSAATSFRLTLIISPFYSRPFNSLTSSDVRIIFWPSCVLISIPPFLVLKIRNLVFEEGCWLSASFLYLCFGGGAENRTQWKGYSHTCLSRAALAPTRLSPPFILAERLGFEPRVDIAAHGGFQDRCNKPDSATSPCYLYLYTRFECLSMAESGGIEPLTFRLPWISNPV